MPFVKQGLKLLPIPLMLLPSVTIPITPFQIINKTFESCFSLGSVTVPISQSRPWNGMLLFQQFFLPVCHEFSNLVLTSDFSHLFLLGVFLVFILSFPRGCHLALLFNLHSSGGMFCYSVPPFLFFSPPRFVSLRVSSHYVFSWVH